MITAETTCELIRGPLEIDDCIYDGKRTLIIPYSNKDINNNEALEIKIVGVKNPVNMDTKFGFNTTITDQFGYVMAQATYDLLLTSMRQPATIENLKLELIGSNYLNTRTTIRISWQNPIPFDTSKVYVLIKFP